MKHFMERYTVKLSVYNHDLIARKYQSVEQHPICVELERPSWNQADLHNDNRETNENSEQVI
jgi:hypothetical protein